MSALKSFFIGLGIVVAFALVFTFGVALTAYEEATPYIEREYPTVVFEHSETCSTPCTSPLDVRAFSPPDGANRLQASFTVAMGGAGGRVQLKVTDPEGGVRYERAFDAGAGAQTYTDTVAWDAMEGSWSLQTTQVAFSGTVSAEIVSFGIPPGTL